MKIHFKNIISFLLVICMLTFAACKNTSNNNSSVTDVVSEPIETELDNIIGNETVDPENNENNRGNGEAVQFQKNENKTGKADGIDVSKWQGKIDWAKVKSAGIDFAIIRIGYRGENGVIYRDDNADYNIQQAQKAGVLVGVYFFSTAINKTEARDEAAWTTQAIKCYKISYPVVYDCEGYTNESSRMYDINATERTDNAIEFLSYIKNSGYDAMIYGAKADFENANYWDITRMEKDYKIWVAHYSQAVYPTKQTPSYSGRYDMWQYTNRGAVDGIEGNCDMVISYFMVDEAVAKDSSTTPQDAKPPKTQEEMLYTDINDQVTAKEMVNLRERAGTKYNIVATLKSGEFVTRTGVGSNGWSRLLYNGKIVYAITSYLSNEVIEKEEPDTVNGMTFTACNDQVTAKMEVNLRVMPTTNSEVIGTLTSGTFLTRTATSDKGWSRIELNGQTVYAVTNYLTTEAPEIKSEENPDSNTTVTEYGTTFTLVAVNVTAKEEVNLRDMPTTSGSKVVYTLKNGEYITKTGISDSGWARLEYNGQTVYCIDSFLMQ